MGMTDQVCCTSVCVCVGGGGEDGLITIGHLATGPNHFPFRSLIADS